MTVPFDLASRYGSEDESFEQKPTQQSTEAVPNANTPMAGRGPLLEEQDDKKVAATITKWLRDQAKSRRRRKIVAQWVKFTLKGVRGLQVRPTNEDVTEFELYRAPMAPGLSTIMARARQLIERIVSHLLSDPPQLEAEPEDDSDGAKEAAEVTTRILGIEGAESGFNLPGTLRRASRKSSIHGSAFIYPCVDAAGGGWRPMEIEALAEAKTVQDATTDPLTQQPVPAGDPRLKNRYVREDNSLSDSPAEAKRQWMPKIHTEVLTPENVALIPEDCSGIATAMSAIIIQYPTISDLRAKFPETFGKYDDATIRGLMSWKPEEAPKGTVYDSALAKAKSYSTGDELDDSCRVCTLSWYAKSQSSYPTGAYIVVTGDKVLHKQPWSGMVQQEQEEGEYGLGSNVVEECLEIPLAQIRQLDDDEEDDPMGRGVAFELCEIDEQRTYILNAWNDYLDRILHPYTFVPLGSTISPKQLQLRTGEPLYFNPQGKPEMEKVDPFPADGKEFFDRTTLAGNDATGLSETAQATEVPSVNSGDQAAIVVQQAAKNLSSIRQNMQDGAERLGRLIVQQWRVFFTIPMQAKYLGDDETWRTTEWSRADMGSTRVVRIKPGTFSQMTPEQKEAKASQQLQMGVITPDQFQEIVFSGVRPQLGVKNNPHLVRVKRQISQWNDGPPEGWMPPQPQMQQGIGPNGPVVQQVMPVDPSNPFVDRRQVDQDRAVATIRYQELAKHQSESGYIRKPQEWRGYFDQALNEARMACGAYTLAEQQQMAAQQQQQQAMNDQNAANADNQSKERQQDSKQAHDERKLQIAGQQRASEQAANQSHDANMAHQRAMQKTGEPSVSLQA